MMDLDEKRVWKIIPLAGLAFTSVFVIIDFILYARGELSAEAPIPFGFLLAVDAVTMIAFILLALLSPNPYGYAAICAAHGILNVINGSETLGFMLYALGTAFLFRAGGFKTRPRIKLVAIGTALLCSVLTNLATSPMRFFQAILSIGSLSLAFAVLLFLFYPYLNELLPPAHKPVIRLADLRLKERDCDFLRRVLVNEKYDSIAAAYHISESTVKQRMLVLYRKLGVENRSEFLVLASQNELCFNPAGEAEGQEPVEE